MNIVFSGNFCPFDISDYETLTAFPCVLFKSKIRHKKLLTKIPHIMGLGGELEEVRI